MQKIQCHFKFSQTRAVTRPIVRPSDRPSIQSRVRPTDSPSSLTETQNKYCVECYDIYSIHSHYKGGGRWPPPQKRCRGLRPRHLFCGFLCIGFEVGECRCCDHNTCLACRCDWTSCSVPLRLHVPSPFVPCALARKGGLGALTPG